MLMIAVASPGLRAVCRDATRPLDRVIEVQDLDSAQQILARLTPSMLVADLSLCGGRREDLQRLLAHGDRVRIILIGDLPYAAAEIDLYLAGARAVCPAALDAPLLLRVLAAVDRGETWIRRALVPSLITRLRRRPGRSCAPMPVKPDALAAMTAREAQVAHLVAGGYSNKQIARKLAITERTVKFHVSSLFRKLGVDDRLMLALTIAARENPVPLAAIAAARPGQPASGDSGLLLRQA